MIKVDVREYDRINSGGDLEAVRDELQQRSQKRIDQKLGWDVKVPPPSTLHVVHYLSQRERIDLFYLPSMDYLYSPVEIFPDSYKLPAIALTGGIHKNDIGILKVKEEDLRLEAGWRFVEKIFPLEDREQPYYPNDHLAKILAGLRKKGFIHTETSPLTIPMIDITVPWLKTYIDRGSRYGLERGEILKHVVDAANDTFGFSERVMRLPTIAEANAWGNIFAPGFDQLRCAEWTSSNWYIEGGEGLSYPLYIGSLLNGGLSHVGDKTVGDFRFRIGFRLMGKLF